MPDFKKAMIYKIWKDTHCYIGSTTNFSNRKHLHKIDCEVKNSLLYKTIRDNGGFDTWKIEIIKQFPCENKIQLLIEEDKCIKEFGGNLNKNRAYLTDEETRLKNIERITQKYHNNTDFRNKILQQRKHRYETDEDYKQRQIQNANRRYNIDIDYRNKAIERSKQRYLQSKTI